tara:strand:- start:535 stop:864 length:330 start_codon:yes stop_codon:yes gene_type:complete
MASYSDTEVSWATLTAETASAENSQIVPVGQRIRLKSIIITGGSASISLRNGSVGDAEIIPLERKLASSVLEQIDIPERGVLFDNGLNVSFATSSATYAVDEFVIIYEG